jgi:E3 ubiquitin-protein ligase TRIP12
VTLVNELLPTMPDTEGNPITSTSISGTSSRGAGRKYSAVTIGRVEESEQGAALEISAREMLLRSQPQLLLQFGTDLFAVLVQVYGSSVNPPVRYKCLAAINKLLYFSTSEMLRSLLIESNISSFLAGVLASKDASILLTALRIAEMLMQKLPDVFFKMFVKEGVVHAVDVLIASDQPGPPSPLLASKLDAATSAGRVVPGPSRSRRGGAGRRKSAGNNDVAVEEACLSTSAPLPPVRSPPSAGSAKGTLRSEMQVAAIAFAKQFKDTYFPGDTSIADAGVTQSLCKLKNLCSQLNCETVVEIKGKGKGKVKAAGSINEDQMVMVLSEILAELGRGDGVSTFEFIGSGVVGALLNFFSCGNTAKDNISNTALRQQALKRLKDFVTVARLPDSVSSNESAPLTLLVRKLQNALVALEQFPVVLGHAPRLSSGTYSIAAGLGALTQPLKLRLCRASGEKSLRDYSANIVLIDPLATLISVEDFLWPHVKCHDLTSISATSMLDASAPIAVLTSEPQHSMKSRSATTFGNGADVDLDGSASTTKRKGKAVCRGAAGAHGADEQRGPETRNAAAHRRAAATSIPVAKVVPECESEVCVI